MTTLLRILILATFITGSLAALPYPSEAKNDGCDSQGSFMAGSSACLTLEQARTEYAEGTAAGFSYEFVMQCNERGNTGCIDPQTCQVPSGTILFAMYRISSEGAREELGYLCIGGPDEVVNTGITPGRVRTAFQRLTWPQAELTIQPTGGETLVNLDTIFHTTNPGPITQNITLLGQHIQIEATPTTWTWHWNTTGPTHTTNHPGAPYPRHTITHQYTTTGTTQPSVDVTYTGRYRVNNNHWQDIPGTHTVNGTPQTLTIHQARPHLVR